MSRELVESDSMKKPDLTNFRRLIEEITWTVLTVGTLVWVLKAAFVAMFL